MDENARQEKIRTLVRQLISRTNQGKIDWTDTADRDAFRANMQGGMVRVQRRMRLDEDGQEVEDFSVTLLDPKGREVEEYSPMQQHAVGEVMELWQIGRRSARGTDDVLTKLLSETASN